MACSIYCNIMSLLVLLQFLTIACRQHCMNLILLPSLLLLLLLLLLQLLELLLLLALWHLHQYWWTLNLLSR